MSINFEPQAICIDVDGTITDEKYLLNLKAIKYLRILEVNGIPVMFASGNALPVLKALARYIGCSGAVIAEDGGVVEYKEKMYLLGSREEPLKFLSVLKSKVGNIEESFFNRYRHVDVAIKRTIDIDIILSILKDFPNLKVVDSKFAFHIHDKDVDKGRGLKFACKLMNIDVSKVIAIGDSEIDIPMFTVAGYSVALANAPNSVKSLADYVTRKSYGDGFVEFIKVLLDSLRLTDPLR